MKEQEEEGVSCRWSAYLVLVLLAWMSALACCLFYLFTLGLFKLPYSIRSTNSSQSYYLGKYQEASIEKGIVLGVALIVGAAASTLELVLAIIAKVRGPTKMQLVALGITGGVAGVALVLLVGLFGTWMRQLPELVSLGWSLNAQPLHLVIPLALAAASLLLTLGYLALIAIPQQQLPVNSGIQKQESLYKLARQNAEHHESQQGLFGDRPTRPKQQDIFASLAQDYSNNSYNELTYKHQDNYKGGRQHQRKVYKVKQNRHKQPINNSIKQVGPVAPQEQISFTCESLEEWHQQNRKTPLPIASRPAHKGLGRYASEKVAVRPINRGFADWEEDDYEIISKHSSQEDSSFFVPSQPFAYNSPSSKKKKYEWERRSVLEPKQSDAIWQAPAGASQRLVRAVNQIRQNQRRRLNIHKY